MEFKKVPGITVYHHQKMTFNQVLLDMELFNHLLYEEILYGHIEHQLMLFETDSSHILSKRESLTNTWGGLGGLHLYHDTPYHLPWTQLFESRIDNQLDLRNQYITFVLEFEIRVRWMDYSGHRDCNTRGGVGD